MGEDWNVYSLGIETHGVNPKAIEAMKEVDIDILEQSPLVVTLCSDADDNCPILPPNVKKNTGALMIQRGKEWPEFQRVRDEIGKEYKIQRNARLM